MVQSLQAICSLWAGESKGRFPDCIETEITQFVLSDCKLPQAVFFYLFNFPYRFGKRSAAKAQVKLFPDYQLYKKDNTVM